MAKSFKQLTAKPDVQKRTSEKDFLDFLDQERGEVAAPPKVKTSTDSENTTNTKNTSNTGKRSKTGNTKNGGNPSKLLLPSNTNNTSVIEDAHTPNEVKATKSTNQESKVLNSPMSTKHNDTNVMGVTDDTADVRQTFIIGQQYLDRLKDYVHTRRVSGQYEYTQKQALHDALDRLFEGVTIAVRPEHIRQQEEVRKQRIRRGIPKQ